MLTYLSGIRKRRKYVSFKNPFVATSVFNRVTTGFHDFPSSSERLIHVMALSHFPVAKAKSK